MTYTLYKSTDVDAPQLPDNLSILKACLVTGYGTGADEKQGAGWSLAYDEPTKKVFQSLDPKGEDLMLRLDATVANRQRISAWNSMTDVDTGNKAYDCGYLSANAGAWFLIATSSWFLLFSEGRAGVFAQTFFGDLTFLPEKDKKTITINSMTTYRGGAPSSYAAVTGAALKKQSNNKVINAHTAFNANNVNTATSGDLVWADIAVSDTDGIIGVLPVLKATPINAGLQTWHQIEPDVYALQVHYGGQIKQMVMDFNNV